jgi:serine/threonine protein kinase
VKVLKHCGPLDSMINELQGMHRWRHPHLVDFLGACTKDRRVMIVTELMSGGSLADLLASSSGKRLPFFRAIQIANDIAGALSYLSS